MAASKNARIIVHPIVLVFVKKEEAANGSLSFLDMDEND
jgi:hypothetical protein